MEQVVEGAKAYREKLTKGLGSKEEEHVIAMAHLMVAVQTSNAMSAIHKLILDTGKQYFQMKVQQEGEAIRKSIIV